MTRSTAVFCRYHFDPLDRLAAVAPIGEPAVLRFYQKTRLATEIQGAVQSTLFQHEDQLLAQQQGPATTLLACDAQRSVLHLLDSAESKANAYNPYGHAPADSGLTCLLGFSGERRDPVTGHYLLGNGYRAFNPVLMRFNSPDSLSPFGEGGLNAYGYCQGDPVNFRDPTGHMPLPFYTRSGPYFPRRTALPAPSSPIIGSPRRSSTSVAPLSAPGAVASPIASTSSTAASVVASTSQRPSETYASSANTTRVPTLISEQKSKKYKKYFTESKTYGKHLNNQIPQTEAALNKKRRILLGVIKKSARLETYYQYKLPSTYKNNIVAIYIKARERYRSLALELQGYLAALPDTVASIRSPSNP